MSGGFRGVSTLALLELLTAVISELDERGEHGGGGGVDPVQITTEWGDLSRASDGWSFVWYAEPCAEAALRDRG